MSSCEGRCNSRGFPITQRQRNLKSMGQILFEQGSSDGWEKIKALALASYEDGGLESVLKTILTAPDWDDALLQAFKHFLVEHIRFDSDPEQGHGALCPASPSRRSRGSLVGRVQTDVRQGRTPLNSTDSLRTPVCLVEMIVCRFSRTLSASRTGLLSLRSQAPTRQR